jgi:hypothetical protein
MLPLLLAVSAHAAPVDMEIRITLVDVDDAGAGVAQQVAPGAQGTLWLSWDTDQFDTDPAPDVGRYEAPAPTSSMRLALPSLGYDAATTTTGGTTVLRIQDDADFLGPLPADTMQASTAALPTGMLAGVPFQVTQARLRLVDLAGDAWSDDSAPGCGPPVERVTFGELTLRGQLGGVPVTVLADAGYVRNVGGIPEITRYEPAPAGDVTRWVARCVAPASRGFLVVGDGLGVTTLPGCATRVHLDFIEVIDSQLADANGFVVFERALPTAAYGVPREVAVVDLASCSASDVELVVP